MPQGLQACSPELRKCTGKDGESCCSRSTVAGGLRECVAKGRLIPVWVVSLAVEAWLIGSWAFVGVLGLRPNRNSIRHRPPPDTKSPHHRPPLVDPVDPIDPDLPSTEYGFPLHLGFFP